MPNTELDSAAKPVGPGAQLRQARLALKLQPENAAGILRLSPKQILALENDDYSSLAGPTYVRGYLRGYAQLLGLAPEKIVEEYNRLAAAAAPPPVDLTKLTKPEQVTSNDYRVKLVTLAGAALIIGLSAIWWRGKDGPALPSVPASGAYQTESGAMVPEHSIPAAPATGTPPPATLATTSGTTGDAAPQAANPVVLEPAATAPSAATSAPGPRARLVLRAEQESWVDVRDGNQNKLLYENLVTGRVVTVEGPAPLNVFLGNVDGVRVEFNGRPYDASRHKRGAIARFTLSGEAPVVAGEAARKDTTAQLPPALKPAPAAEKAPVPPARPAAAVPLERQAPPTAAPAQQPPVRPQGNESPATPASAN